MWLRESLRLQVYYATIALKDSWRSRTTLLTTATVFAGICLLLLALTGLKSGLVQQLYDDIMKSPSSIKGDWYATNKNQALDETTERVLASKLPKGSLIIPEISKIVTVSLGLRSVEHVTVQATVVGDPFLSFYGASISNVASPELIVSPSVAQELGVSISSLKSGSPTATVEITRGSGDLAFTAKLQVVISAIVGTEGSKAKTAYLSRHFMEQFEDFTQGEAVIERGWPGLPLGNSIGYQGYLSFCKQPYNSEEITRLHLRGFKATDLRGPTIPARFAKWSRLFGFLKPHDLHVYFVTSETQNDQLDEFIAFDASEIESITSCDDTILNWSEPTTVDINAIPHLLVGVSGSWKWLRGYCVDYSARFAGTDMAKAILPFNDEESNLMLGLSDDRQLKLTRVPASESITRIDCSQITTTADDIAKVLFELTKEIESNLLCELDIAGFIDGWSNCGLRKNLVLIDEYLDAGRRPIAFVPAKLLSAVQRHRLGSLTFDNTNQEFQRINSPNQYFSGRFYARVLEDVPFIDEYLQQAGYSTVSSKLRVLEMQGYAGTLDLLVSILQSIAIVLGIVTTSVIFMEVTRRRQTSIGIMRIMGMQSQGIFLFVFLRAILIAILGWVIASSLAMGIGIGLPLFANAECKLQLADYIRVLVGAVVCSGVGVAYHAWYAATKLDPILAIKSGKVQ